MTSPHDPRPADVRRGSRALSIRLPGRAGATSATACTVGMLVRAAAEAFGERTFVRSRGGDFSFAEMDRRSNRTAHAFRSLGVGPGSRVAILCSNRIEYLDLWFGLAKIGAVQLPLNTAYKGPQLLQAIGRAEVPFIVVEGSQAAELDRIGRDLGACRHLVTLDGEARKPKRAAAHDFADLVSSASEDEPPDPQIDGTAVGAIMNTSGTTGTAKGVLLPHAQQCWLGHRIADALRLGPDDVYYNVFPLFHNTSQAMITLPAMLTGSQMVLTEKFSLSAFWSDVRRFDVTAFYYIGEILRLLVRSGTASDAQGTRLRAGWGIGGAPGDVERFERTHRVSLGTGYGSTEGNVPVFRPLGDDPGSAAAGRVLPEFEVRVADPSGRDVRPGELGEILIRSEERSLMFAGYDGNPEATSEAMRDGWFHSGDAGRFDRNGSLHFASRIKDVIRVRGENVSGAEVEDVLLAFPGVVEAAAVAVPCELGGDDVKVVLVAAVGAEVDPAALVRHCETLLPKFALPRYVEQRPSLPKTATNKVQKTLLREDPFNDRTWDRAIQARMGDARFKQVV